MLTTHPTPELASPPAAGEAARLAGHARLAAAALLAFGSAGLLAGLLTANALGVLLAMGGCGAGAYLLWSARQPGPEGDYPGGAGGRAADVPGGQAGRPLLQAAALACDALAALGKALLKVLACA